MAVPPSVQARRLAAKYFSRIILILEVLGYNKTAWDKDLIPRMGLKLRPARSSGIKKWAAEKLGVGSPTFGLTPLAVNLHFEEPD